jgi:RNA polymerase sigma-70 factor (ECF subfamily)
MHGDAALGENGAQAVDSDRSLAQTIAAGDTRAFACLMRRFNQRLYRTARAVLRDPTEAEDALQDAYLHAYHSMAQFRGEASLSTWLTRLVVNECLARIRRSKRRQNVVPLVVNSERRMSEAAGDELDLPEQRAARAQMRRIIEDKVDELPEDYRLIFVLRSVEELSVEETAKCLNLEEATVRSRHFRARSLLREALSRQIDLAERDLFEFGGSRCGHIIDAVLSRL